MIGYNPIIPTQQLQSDSPEFISQEFTREFTAQKGVLRILYSTISLGRPPVLKDQQFLVKVVHFNVNELVTKTMSGLRALLSLLSAI